MDDQLYKSDDGNALRFYYQPIRNNFQSEKHGRPIHDKQLMVDVLTPGSNEAVPTFELERVYCEEAGIPAPERSSKYAQYEKQIDAFKRQNGEMQVDGTPLSAWPQIDVAQIANLRAQNIFSVEQLTTVSDGHLNNLGLGARVLRDQAIAYLNSRQFGVPSAQAAAETANLREENDRLRGEVQSLNDRLTTALSQLQAMQQGQPPAAAPAPVVDTFGFGQTPPPPPAPDPLTPNPDPMFGLGTAPAAAPLVI